MPNKTKAALQGRQCQNAYQIHSQLITQIDQVKRCAIVRNGNSSSVKRAERNFTLCHGNNELISAKPQALLPVLLYFAGGCFGYISGDSTSPKFLGGVFPVVCDDGVLTAPLAQFAKASRSLNQRRNSALGNIENYHLLTQIFGAVGNITHRNPDQPLGSMPRFRSSSRPSSFNQLPRLTSSFLASFSNCSFRSRGIRIWKVGALPVPFGCLSRLMIVDMYVPMEVMFLSIGTYIITMEPIRTTPYSASTHAGRLTKPLIEVTIMACFKSTQTHPKFQYRFLALNRHDKKAKPCRLSVEATTEHEARRILAPHFILSFAARLPVQEVRHV